MAGGFSKKSTTTPSKPKPVLGAKRPQQNSNSAKQNKSILNFFQKTDGPPQATSRQPRITQFTAKNGARGGSGGAADGSLAPLPREDSCDLGFPTGSLFLEDHRGGKMGGSSGLGENERERSRTPDDIWEDGGGDDPGEEQERYNENGSAMKRRKVSPFLEGQDGKEQKTGDKSSERRDSANAPKTSGPFIDESDIEDEEDLDAFREVEQEPTTGERSNTDGWDTQDENDHEATERASAVDIPPLVREATSHIEDDEYANFDDLDEDNMQEEFLGPLSGNECEEEAVCPICQTGLVELSEIDVSVHVNNCLDGTSAPLAPDKGLTRSEKATVARPAQRDPYAAKESDSKSAFSKLMAGNAEDTAWEAAATNNVLSRGKQAYQRTCPFYKIIPNFSICVDAFRYGAVQDCNAYFLSHFHSDHYVGLTASWRHGSIYCSKVTANLVRQQLKVDPKWIVVLEFEKATEVPGTGGARVTLIDANHCPGSALFLFEKRQGQGPSARLQRVLHCGDFRATPAHIQHALLRPETVDATTGLRRVQNIDVCYLDTTYMSPKYSFPSQGDVITACADLSVRLDQGEGDGLSQGNDGGRANGMMRQFVSAATGKGGDTDPRPKGRLLVVMGTYSIGKEKICVGIARALRCKIYATAAKRRICACLEDEELSSLLTDDPVEAQIHMQTVFEIRAETLADYLASMKPHFSRVVGFRPTGWSYRPPAGRMLDNPSVPVVLHSPEWKTGFTSKDLVPQRGSTRESACYGVPYSEHSSFRELTQFCCALRISRVIPTVNVGSQKIRESMKAWLERWEAEKRRNGLYTV